MVAGSPDHAEQLRGEVEQVLAPMGLRLSEAKTDVVHIDEGFDFLGFRIQRQTKEGTNRAYVYTFPAKKALASIMRKVKTITRQGTNNALSNLLRQLNAVLRGWTTYFKHGVSSDTFGYLRHYTWWRVVRWLRRKHRRTSWKKLRARFLRYDDKTWARDGTVELFDPMKVAVTRYRYRGDIPTPWTRETADAA